MRRFLLASHNQHKIKEFKAILADMTNVLGEFELFSFDDISIPDDIVEDGTTFEENALIKARAGAALGYITIADDSGLAVDALNGAPGIFSARYAGEHGDDDANNRLLIHNLQGKENRCARYVCAIACAFPNGDTFTVRGECEGLMIDTPRGSNGFGYDPFFYVPALQMTFAEASPEEKNKISHRGLASHLFASKLTEYFANGEIYAEQ